MTIRSILTVIWLAALSALLQAEDYVSEDPIHGGFPVVAHGRAAEIFVSESDFAGVRRVASHLQADIETVTGRRPKLSTGRPEGERVVIVGTVGKSPFVDQLIEAGKIDASAVAGRWETFGLQTVESPFPGVERGLVIFGSDKRGTIFGIYDLSTKMGVSPWHWWADVPAQKKPSVYVAPGFHSMGEPKVKYRGLFINDEAPALTHWAEATFGGFNSAFYEKVFELILRNKGNYLWPAMWVPAAFYVDDPESAKLADEMGVVIGTTHHEPMGRAHAEWAMFGEGPWNYETNAENLREFWRGGFERLGDTESLVTIGMRGDGDEAMTESTAIDLMKRIIADQREIIEAVTGEPAAETPQVWALYKEMQDYYDKGMRVPDDVLILLCDDNWGNVRILPKQEDLDREGGFGVYYHFDFVGGPVSYRWLNVTQIERVWEQMRLSYEWGARELWLVNVGDIKPMELPTSFFLDFAWDPTAMDAADLPGYYVDWARQQFGAAHAEEIAEQLAFYTKYNARRTPEMLQPDTYHLTNFREADRVLAAYRELRERARAVYETLPKRQKSAYYQLVLFPIEACCNLHEMYVAAGRNNLYATQGRASANLYADRTKTLFERDAELARYFHEELEDGKWNHMMSQTHIGYTHWNNPPVNKMPAVSYVQVDETPGFGYAIENGAGPGASTQGGARYGGAFPEFDPLNDQEYYIELFNTGRQSAKYKLESDAAWIVLSKREGTLRSEEKVFVSIDWSKVPRGTKEGEIVLSGEGERYGIAVPLRAEVPEGRGFLENNGVVSFEATRFQTASDNKAARWTEVPNLGRTGSSMIIEPMDAPRQDPNGDAPRLEYAFTLFDAGEVTVEIHLSPTLNYKKNEGLKFAVAIDDEEPRIVNMHEGETVPDWEYPQWWNTSVTDRIKIKRTVHAVEEAGRHTLKVWMVDPGVVFQKFVIDAGGLKPSYLGPPESAFKEN